MSNYIIKGYSYPFQEARYWIGRSRKNRIASWSNTNTQTRKVIDKIYQIPGVDLVLIPGGKDDDYSEQLYIRVTDTTRASVTTSINNILREPKFFTEILSFSIDDIGFRSEFLIADWSASAKYGDRFMRCKE